MTTESPSTRARIVSGEPGGVQHLIAAPLREEVMAEPELPDDDRPVGLGDGGRKLRSDPTAHDSILQRDDELMLRRELDERGADRKRPDRIDDRRGDALLAQPMAHLEGHPDELSVPDDEHPGVRFGGEDVHAIDRANGGDVVRHVLLRVADHRGRVLDMYGLVERLAQARRVTGFREAQTGYERCDRVVPDTVMARTVRPSDAATVQHHSDAEAMERHIHEQLVEGPVEERRVQRHDRVQPCHREAGRGRDRMLLGDADVEGT